MQKKNWNDIARHIKRVAKLFSKNLKKIMKTKKIPNDWKISIFSSIEIFRIVQIPTMINDQSYNKSMEKNN